MTGKPNILSRLPQETYDCPECSGFDLSWSELKTSWKCPQCLSYVVITAINCNKERMPLLRKKAEEVKKGDYFYFCHRDDGNLVLGTRISENIISIGLQGYGQLKFQKNNFVECIY